MKNKITKLFKIVAENTIAFGLGILIFGGITVVLARGVTWSYPIKDATNNTLTPAEYNNLVDRATLWKKADSNNYIVSDMPRVGIGVVLPDAILHVKHTSAQGLVRLQSGESHWWTLSLNPIDGMFYVRHKDYSSPSNITDLRLSADGTLSVKKLEVRDGGASNVFSDGLKITNDNNSIIAGNNCSEPDYGTIKRCKIDDEYGGNTYPYKGVCVCNYKAIGHYARWSWTAI